MKSLKDLKFLTILLILWGSPKVLAQQACERLFLSLPTSTSTILPIHIFEFRMASHDGIEINSSGITYVNADKIKWQIDSRNFSVRQNVQTETTVFEAHLDSQQEQTLFSAKAALVTPDGRDDSHQSKFYLSSGLSLNAKSLTPGLIYTLVFHHPSEVRLEYDLQVSKELTHYEIPWSQFRIVALSGKRAPSLEELFDIHRPVIAGKNNVGLSIEVLQQRQTSSMPSSISLEIQGPIAFEKDLQEPLFFERLLQLPLQDSEGMNLSLRDHVLQKTVDNLYNPNYQAEVMTVAHRGEKALVDEIKKLGFGIVYLDGALTFQNFFAAGGVMESFPLHVPVEKSEFGKEHSVWAHAMQILVMTKNLNPEELDMFKKIIRATFGSKNQISWGLWDSLFDGAGVYRANGPSYWRERDRAEGIPENINGNGIHWQSFGNGLKIGIDIP